MALEELYSHYKRPRTSILMGHARGVICLAAQAGIPVMSYPQRGSRRRLPVTAAPPKRKCSAPWPAS